MVVVVAPFNAPMEGIICQIPTTKLLVNDVEIGTATLYITEHDVTWGGGLDATGGPSPTVQLLYPSISLHAIQRTPQSALYMVINHELHLPQLPQPNQDDDDDYDADEIPITQLRFLPPNENDVDQLYEAMTHGQSLHPDPSSSPSHNDDDYYMDGEDFNEGEDEFEDAEESNVSAEEAAARLRHMRIENVNGAPEPGVTGKGPMDDDAEVE